MHTADSVPNETQQIVSMKNPIESNSSNSSWTHKGQKWALQQVLNTQNTATTNPDLRYIGALTEFLAIQDLEKDNKMSTDRVVINSTKMHVPTETMQLKLRSHSNGDFTSCVDDEVTAVIDGGSALDVISTRIAHKFHDKIKTSKSPKEVQTGNGLVSTDRYLPAHCVTQNDTLMFTRFWVLDIGNVDWLIGLTSATILKSKSIPRDKVWEHIPDELDGVDESLDDMACSLLPTERQTIDYDSVHVPIEGLRDEIHALLRQYDTVIAKHEMDSGKIPNIEFTIDWIDGIENPTPIVCKEYHTKPTAKIEVIRQLNEMVKHGYISDKSTSAWQFPIFGVPKKTGDVRIVFDYRKLNAITKKIKCPIPLIDDLLRRFHNKTHITSLDMKGGYWHIPIAPRDRPKTAFVFNSHLYEWNVMPFGPTNAPSFFQRVMSEIFHPYKDFVVVYIDDISVLSESLEEHIKHLRIVFGVISDYNIRLRLDKCFFGVSETQYLGYNIDKFGIRPQPKYLEKVLQCPRPTTAKMTRRFIGLIEYLHRFIPNAHDHISKLTKLLKKDTKFSWGPEQQNAFETLRALIIGAKYLKHPDCARPFHLFADASINGIGGMLAQYHETVLYPVAFCSKTFTQTQRNWHISEQEIFAVIHLCEKWRSLLLHGKFTVYTDHKNLEQLFNKAKDFKSGKLYRWAVRLQDYHFVCKFIEGKTNVMADYLSREGLGLATTTTFEPIGERKANPIEDIEHVYFTYLLMQTTGVPLRYRVVNSLPLNLPNLNKYDHVVAAPKRRPAPCSVLPTERRIAPISNVQHPVLEAHRFPKGSRYSHRLAAKPSSKQSRALAQMPLHPIPPENPSDADRAYWDDIVSQIRTFNDSVLSHRPDVQTWNKGLLQPVAAPTFEVYDETLITTEFMYEKQRHDPMLFAIITFLDTKNVNLIKDLPKYLHSYVTSGRFKLNKNGILHFEHNRKNLPVLPASMRQATMKAEHSHLHPGKNKIISIIKDKYWWPGFQKDIATYTRTCKSCQMIKSGKQKKTGNIKLFPCKRPFQMVSIDLVGPLPVTTDGYRYIVSMIDRFSRYCMLVPVKDMRALTVLNALERWVCTFGPPDSVLSDNGTQFLSALFKHYEATTGIKPKYTTTYHPECNGMIERLHRWIKERLALIAYDLDLDLLDGKVMNDWSIYLNVIQYTYNTLPNVMTAHSPFDLILGQSRMKPLTIEFQEKHPIEYRRYMDNRMAILHGDANYAQGKYDEQRRRQYDRNRKPIHFEVGDHVVYDVTPGKKGNRRKLEETWVGPYEVIAVWNNGNNAQIREINNPQNTMRVQREKIKKYHQPDAPAAAPAASVQLWIENKVIWYDTKRHHSHTASDLNKLTLNCHAIRSKLAGLHLNDCHLVVTRM